MLNMPIVYIVVADPQMRAMLQATVRAMGLQAAEYKSADEMLRCFEPRRAGCLILDLHLPGTSGLDLLAEIHRMQLTTATIVISDQATVADAVQAMKWGAVDFLEKPVSLAQLREAIWRALVRQKSERAHLHTRYDVLERVHRLTPDERSVARLTALGEPDKRIAAELDVSTRTVQLRRASVMKKLDLQTRADLIRLVESTPADVWESAARPGCTSVHALSRHGRPSRHTL